MAGSAVCDHKAPAKNIAAKDKRILMTTIVVVLSTGRRLPGVRLSNMAVTDIHKLHAAYAEALLVDNPFPG